MRKGGEGKGGRRYISFYVRVESEPKLLGLPEGSKKKGLFDSLDSPGERHVRVMVHPVCAKFKTVSGHFYAGKESLLGVPEA